MKKLLRLPDDQPIYDALARGWGSPVLAANLDGLLTPEEINEVITGIGARTATSTTRSVRAGCVSSSAATLARLGVADLVAERGRTMQLRGPSYRTRHLRRGEKCGPFVLLSPPCVTATLASLGVAEASSAGEQLGEEHPIRAVTNFRRGRLLGLPAPVVNCHCPPVTARTPARGAERSVHWSASSM